ncbi:hypothetical protein FRC12_000142 [Ceratobasidium sp. 428]|nr:hypothetical protein FRC12_000142 [Ceratobasidium sp. 428]
MLRFGRGTRLQNAIIDSFPPRGIRPTPIWSLREIEPDAAQREYLRQIMATAGVSEVDFLRWRNACVAPNIKTAVDYIRGAETPTPLWVTSHMLRRKIYNVEDASLAAYLALLAVPSSGRLVSAYESPLILSLEHIADYGLSYALPATVSRILALPTKNHRHLLSVLSSPNFARSPIMTTTLRRIVEDIVRLPLIISKELWLQVWERWGVNRSLGEVFSKWLEASMRTQGVKPPFTYTSSAEKTYTIGATYFKQNTTSAPDSSLAALTAASKSERISARLLLSIAHSLIHGFFPRPPDPRNPPDEAFVTVLIDGLIRRKSYGRAQAVWKDAERKISSGSERDVPVSSSISSEIQQMTLTLTPALFEAGLASYAKAGDLRRALNLLDKYALSPHNTTQTSTSPPAPNPEADTQKEPSGPPSCSHVTPSALNIILPHLPPHAQQLVFSHSAQMWGIQPDSTALETVMYGALHAHAEHDQGLLQNLREFREGFRRIFRKRIGLKSHTFGSDESDNLGDWNDYEERLNIALDPVHQSQDRILLRQNAIKLFRSVVLGNWPLIASPETSHDDDPESLLAPRNIKLFTPIPLRRKLDSKASTKPKTPNRFLPAPLHPSPTPRFLSAHPTPRAWTAYLALLPAAEIPEGLGWMRAADESIRHPNEERITPRHRTDDDAAGMYMFRPERAALLDALIRWEAVSLASESLVGRAMDERARRVAQLGSSEVEMNEVGPEGALRDWLVDWLGAANVPSREEVARARLDARYTENDSL